MGSEFVPAQVFCLAEYLCDEMLARKWTTEDVAIRMGNGRDLARDLLCLDLIVAVPDKNLLIGDEMIEGLSNAFGISQTFFRKIDEQWRNATPEQRSSFKAPEKIFGSHRYVRGDDAQ